MSSESSFNQKYKESWEVIGWEPSEAQTAQFLELQKLLIHFNKEVNLTRLLNGDEYWISQVFDSLWPLKDELRSPKQPRKCIDIGTGCGFPGLALTIALPGSTMTLVDSSGRKTRVIKEIAVKLGLSSRVIVMTERAELIGQSPSFRGLFDLAMARAVASAPVVAEYLIPLLNVKGEALLFKGKWTDQENKGLEKALIPLMAKISKTQYLELPLNRGSRHLIRLQANSPCPKRYPRTIGVPEKRPLGN